MPARPNKQALFIRWFWLVYLPLGLLIVALPLVALKVVTGGAVWLVGLLSLYCVVPIRLLGETRRKGLQLPKPEGLAGKLPFGSRDRRPRRPAARTVAAPHPERSDSGPADTRRVDRPAPSPKIRRRRAAAGMLAIAGLGLLGGLLFIVGMERASSGRLGLLLIGAGLFLMVLAVTLPTFKIVDITVRALGRLMSRLPGSRA